MEKHWKSVIPRSICDYFFDAQRKANNNEDIPPVITTPHHYLLSILRSNLFFVAVCMTEGKFCTSAMSYVIIIEYITTFTRFKRGFWLTLLDLQGDRQLSSSIYFAPLASFPLLH